MVSPQVLKRYPHFAGNSEDCLKQIAAITDRHSFDAGEEICTEGAVATHLCILISGLVDVVYLLGDNRFVVADTLYQGEAFGWSALIPPHKLTASCVGRKAGEFLSVQGDGLRRLCDEDAEFGCRISIELAKLLRDRLSAMRVQLAAAQQVVAGSPA